MERGEKMAVQNPSSRSLQVMTDPPIAQSLFGDVRWSWLWLATRLYIGYTWLSSGLGKINNPAWVSTGEALKGFWARAIQVPEAPARPAIAFNWYRVFIEGLLNSGSYTWFSKVVVAGELLIGIALILGAFTGIAAFFGAFMNWNFMMAGTASINPLMFVVTILIILAWKTAGWWGLDRWLLPSLGTPWRPGGVFEKSVKKEVSNP
jgi:thiosulfate dehydrogenase (quinone) large subunit